MRSPLYIHALWLLVLVAILSMGAMSSRGPSAAVDALARAELVELRGELDRVRMALVDAEEKVKFITIETGNIGGVSGPHMIVTGCNVHLHSGSGQTGDGLVYGGDEAANVGKYKGLGNLIIGYNEGVVGLTDRRGSHNLVIGYGHKFPSRGGLVTGLNNTVSGQNCTVVGGTGNIASGTNASVCGGSNNKSSGLHTTVVAGSTNEASGKQSCVTCGSGNKATAEGAVVSAGSGNTAAGISSSVSGGRNNTAAGIFSSISEGADQTKN